MQFYKPASVTMKQATNTSRRYAS